MPRCRLHLGSTILATATGALLIAPSAQAQAQATAPDAGTEVVVTALRSSQRLQDTPASVSVLTATQLRNAGVVTTEDAVQLIPGVTIVTNTAEVGDTQINIRGVNGARDAESSVALVVDGILKTNTAVLNQDQGDVQQFEVLKGPQGAYYGRNAAAGAVVITTRKPTDTFTANARASYGNDSTFTGFASLSGPITDKIGWLLEGDYRKSDGFYRNTGPIAAAQGATVDPFDGFDINGRILAKPTDKLTLDFKGRYQRATSGSYAYNVAFNLPNLATAFGSPAFNEDVNRHDFVFDSNIPSFDRLESKEFSLKADLDLGWGKLSAWGLYSDVSEGAAADAAVAAFGAFNTTSECVASVASLYASGYQLPAPLFLTPTPAASILGAFSPTTCDGTQYQLRTQTDFSAEVRLSSRTDQRLRWSLGAYYLNIKRHVGVSLGYDRGQGVLQTLYNPPGSSNPTEQLSNDRFGTNVYAGFGSVDYDVTRQFTASFALRYDSEARDVSNEVDPTARNSYIDGGGQPLNVGLNSGPLTHKSKTFDQFEPRVNLLYKLSRDWSAYATGGVGFKSGGFNNQGSEATVESIYNLPAINAGLNISDQYKKEVSTSYEVGLKGQALQRRLSLSVAGYRTNVHDMQFFEFYAGPFGILRVVSNIDRVTITGVEGAADYRVGGGLDLFTGFNYNDSRIDRDSARPGAVGGESPYTSKYTVNAGAEYTRTLSADLKLIARVDYRRVGPTFFSTAQGGDRPTIFNLSFGPFLGTGNYANSKRDAYDITNARISLKHGAWTATAFAQNLFDKAYLAEVIPAPEFGGSFIAPGNRRYYGVELAASF